jgi:hypothetical protein
MNATKDFTAQDFERMLEEGYVFCNENIHPMSRLAYLGSEIFDFTTYDEDMDELFATKAVEVCRAIQDRTTFDYINDRDQYVWYLTMMNMPFFAKRTEWGTSIRGAWWDGGGEYESCSLWSKGNQVTELEFTRETWPLFIDAIIRFSSVG